VGSFDDYDLLDKIRNTIQDLKSSISFNLVWVKGHFMGKNREIQHDLNDEAHRLAVSALSLNSIQDIAPPSPLSGTSMWTHSNLRVAEYYQRSVPL
jgi:hypothetical protein